MMNILVSIDPGKASGWGVFDYTDLNNVYVMSSGEYNQFTTCESVEKLFTENDLTGFPPLSERKIDIVMEKFTITAQTGKNTNAENWSAEIIGTCRYFAKKYNAPFTEQTPSEAKSFVPNERLKTVGIWHTGGEGHARDALRHGVLYLIKNKGWRPLGLFALE